MELEKAEYWIKYLGLKAHPEGGYYHETFVSENLIEATSLPSEYGGARKFYTSIYFLLKDNEVSHFHKIKSDEIWTFHAGDALDIHVFDPAGCYQILKLGLNIEKNEKPQQIVKGGSWFGASLPNTEGFSLVGCFVAPGFDFIDFELGNRRNLLEQYPEQKEIIMKLTASC